LRASKRQGDRSHVHGNSKATLVCFAVGDLCSQAGVGGPTLEKIHIATHVHITWPCEDKDILETGIAGRQRWYEASHRASQILEW
jgi:hypothetical protein